MSVYVLPNRLRMLTLPLEVKSNLSHPLVKHILFPASTDRFFVYTENSSEVTLIVDDEYIDPDFAPLIPVAPGLTIFDEVYRALEVEGSEEASSARLITDLASPLSRAGISIFYVSTYQTDLVLVAEDRLLEVISTLRAHAFSFAHLESIELPTKVDILALTKPPNSPLSRPSEDSLVGGVGEEMRKEERREVQPGELALVGLNMEFVELWGPMAIKALLYPELLDSYSGRFVSYTSTGDGVSFVTDATVLDEFNPDWINRSFDAQPLKLIQFSLEGFDMDRYGIVHSVAQPLAADKISLLYLSTVHTANVLVGIEDAERALEVLESSL